MNGTNQGVTRSRRTVLKSAASASVGAGALLTAGAGSVQAGTLEKGDCVEADGAGGGVYVYENCGFHSVDYAENGSTGTAASFCIEAHGRRWVYVLWSDDDITDGWVMESQLSYCFS